MHLLCSRSLQPTVEVDTYTDYYEVDKIIKSMIDEYGRGGLGVCVVVVWRVVDSGELVVEIIC